MESHRANDKAPVAPAIDIISFSMENVGPDFKEFKKLIVEGGLKFPVTFLDPPKRNG